MYHSLEEVDSVILSRIPSHYTIVSIWREFEANHLSYIFKNNKRLKILSLTLRPYTTDVILTLVNTIQSWT